MNIDQGQQDNRSHEENHSLKKQSSSVVSNLRLKLAFKQQRRQLQQKLFGVHYNYSRIGLNKQKKHLLQQQKNTQIERQNLILLQKLQRIVKKPNLTITKKRIITQVQEDSRQHQMRYHSPDRNYESSTKKNKELKKTHINSDYKSARKPRRDLFSGQKEYEGMLYEIISYIQQGKYNISIRGPKETQNIKIDIEAYKQIYRSELDKNHSKVVDLLTFDGKLFGITGLQNLQIEIQEGNTLNLPMIHPHKLGKGKSSFRSKPT